MSPWEGDASEKWNKKMKPAKQVGAPGPSTALRHFGGGRHDKLRRRLAWHLWQTRGRTARRWWRRSRRRGTGDNPSRLTHLISSICVAEMRRFHPWQASEEGKKKMRKKDPKTRSSTFIVKERPSETSFLTTPLFPSAAFASSAFLRSWGMSRRRPLPSAD